MAEIASCDLEQVSYLSTEVYKYYRVTVRRYEVQTASMWYGTIKTVTQHTKRHTKNNIIYFIIYYDVTHRDRCDAIGM